MAPRPATPAARMRFSTSPRLALPPLTRESFILPEHETTAATQVDTMYQMDASGKPVSVPLPAGVKESGVLPEGYSVDFKFDPLALVASLRKAGITEESQLLPQDMKELRRSINAADNLAIVPTALRDQKLATTRIVLDDQGEGDCSCSH